MLSSCMLTMLCGAEIITELLESRQRHKQKENLAGLSAAAQNFCDSSRETWAFMLRPDVWAREEEESMVLHSTRIEHSWGKEIQKYMQKAQSPQWTHCAKWLWLVEVMRRGWKMVKKVESCVNHTHLAGYNSTETFCSSS